MRDKTQRCRKPTARMSYNTLLNMPDSREKFLALERKLMRLQMHGTEFERAKDEWGRLFKIYRKQQ